MLLVLLLSVGVQYNDPDGPAWMAIYGVGAAATVLFMASAARGWWFFWPALLGFLGVGYIVLGVEEVETGRIFSSLNMSGVGVEEVREAGGLLIQSVWLAYLAWRRGFGRG